MTTQNNCPDCGTAVGQRHLNECDIERCSVCGSQWITCNCEDHDPMTSVWMGEWPKENDVSSERLRTLFPIYDRGNEPLVTVDQLKRDVEEVIGRGDELPYLAFVSGSELNLRVEFNDFDADTDRGIVSLGLIELIRRGANRILVVSEVWLRNEETTRWHGAMILESRTDSDMMYVAEFEGKIKLGPWSESEPDCGGNLSKLFKLVEGASG